MRRGVSLGEAIVAIFLIVSAVMVTITLFHSGLRYARMSQTRALAGVYARKVMAQVRDWASDPANFVATPWTPYQGVELSDPDYPGFVARVTRGDGRDLLSPSSELEAIFGAKAHRMRGSLIPVQVTVAWGLPEQSLSVTSLIGEPERELPDDPTVVVQRGSGPAGPVPALGEVQFSAQLLDADGNPIPHVAFSWTLQPVTGNATLLQSDAPHDGSTMTLRNVYQWSPLLSPPELGQVPGEVRLDVVCRYRGRTIANVAPVSVILLP